jgi:hypothetical protein
MARVTHADRTAMVRAGFDVLHTNFPHKGTTVFRRGDCFVSEMRGGVWFTTVSWRAVRGSVVTL